MYLVRKKLFLRSGRSEGCCETGSIKWKGGCQKMEIGRRRKERMKTPRREERKMREKVRLSKKTGEKDGYVRI